MKVANYNKKALIHNYSLQHDPAPPHRQVERRTKEKEDNDNMIEDKGSISFLIPVKATATTAVGESGKATRQLQQKRANRKTARAQRRRKMKSNKPPQQNKQYTPQHSLQRRRSAHSTSYWPE